MSATSGPDLDVLIVGAGPTGLALALQLQRFGARFRIIDKLHDRGRESRAFGVQARSLELLQLFGLGDALVARGNTSTRLKLHVEGRAVVVGSLGDIGAADTRFPFTTGQLHRVPIRGLGIRRSSSTLRGGSSDQSRSAAIPVSPSLQSRPWRSCRS